MIMRPNIYLVDEDRQMYVARGHCVLSGEHYETEPFPLQSYNEWLGGAMIQNALNCLSVDDREFIVSGICPKAFDEMFSEDEDE